MSISRFASQKHEVDTHAEVAVPAEGDVLFPATMKIITGKCLKTHY